VRICNFQTALIIDLKYCYANLILFFLFLGNEMASTARCNIHSQLFCKSCLISNKKQESGTKVGTSKNIAGKRKQNEVTSQIRIKVDELDEHANFLVIYRRPSEGEIRRMNSIGVVSIIEK